MKKKKLQSYVFILIVLIVNSSISKAQGEFGQYTLPCTKIPCILDWYHDFYTLQRGSTNVESLAIDDKGNIYVSAVSKSFYNVDRLILKYKADGTPIYQFNIEGIPWYMGTNNIEDVYDIPWQEIRIDESRNKIFVLFAIEPIPGSSKYVFFLAAHNKNSGVKLANWNDGNSQFIGERSNLRAGIDIDNDGNVWTILEDDPGATVGLQLKKFSGVNGANITPISPRDYFWIGVPNTTRKLIGFGIRKTDNKMFVAFEERNNTGTEDLVVTLRDNTIQFIDRIEFTRELPAPSLVPEPDFPYQNLTDHVHFSDNFVDQDDNFLVAGTYKFRRWIFGFKNDFIFPVALKFGVTANNELKPIFEYISTEQYGTHYFYNLRDEYPLMVAEGNNNSTFISHFRLNLINSDGEFIDHELLRRHWPPQIEEPPGSGCVYINSDDLSDFRYRSGLIISTGRLGKCTNEEVGAWVNVHRKWLPRFIRPIKFHYRIDFRKYWYSYFQSGKKDKKFSNRLGINNRFIQTKRTISFDRIVPTNLSKIYLCSADLTDKLYNPEFPEKQIDEFRALIERTETGYFFNKKLQNELLDSLKISIESNKKKLTKSKLLLKKVNSKWKKVVYCAYL